ncbi:putative Transcriptional regulatory protein pro1 [Venustampulla echinocandica]|uniref:Putative Transcriptional regulatory protein pro1 n=1 Tax=Venustampulla echinocandica TaxID=2656787 RepID=A0A370THC7_9HELO|nr:putative Transcriptional regulatory protein pro1 [Venustampulla echinocandica]RDL34590.1 putative Transcriptional regulatory protein pro1 [Venustampulla echinocandica]
MSTQPPNPQLMSRSNVAMAVAQPKQKSAPKPASNSTTKNKMQMHRRSRTGCYTCRLRRKKCDEGSPSCTACKHLGLRCEYKRPMWWSNNEQRRQQKDNIKMIIKRKKLSEKPSSTTNQVMAPGGETPPGLSHSLPTSATFSDPLDRMRSASIDSQLSLFDFNAPPGIADYTAYNAQMHSSHSQYASMYPQEFSPYEIDVKTERQMFINDIPTRRESTISTFSTYHQPPPPDAMLPSYPAENEWDAACDDRKESLAEEALNINMFDFAHGPAATVRQVAIELDEGDQRLLDHFISDVLPTVFPILETNQHGSVRSDYVLPALQSNKCYLHCCLSIAAQHYKSMMNAQGDQIDNDIMRHRYATISELCEALNRDTDHQAILEATLGMIFFQCSVGRFDDSLPDIPWHQHFQAAISLVQKLNLNNSVLESHHTKSFNMTLTSWIDILGSSIQGRAPTFAHTYREKHLSPTNSSLGLRELMGCDDRVMYLISEIACLDALRKDGMDDIQLCQHVHALGDQIGLTEMGESGPKIPFNAHGVLSPKQLSRNMTAAFRIAARIYLCSLVPGFTPSQASCVGLVEKLTQALEFIPSGQVGFDRSLVWVYLIGGSVSTAGSTFRAFFDDRLMQLGDLANFGSFGRVACLLKEVWGHVDGRFSPGGGEAHYVSWRDVMQMKGWDFLLI